MGLSRRQFTKEFKLAAIQRLDLGASIAEVGVVNFQSTRTCCTGGGVSSVEGPGTRFRG